MKCQYCRLPADDDPSAYTVYGSSSSGPAVKVHSKCTTAWADKLALEVEYPPVLPSRAPDPSTVERFRKLDLDPADPAPARPTEDRLFALVNKLVDKLEPPARGR